MKKLLVVVFLAACAQQLIPEPLIERARIACEPYGGLKGVDGPNSPMNGIRFECMNGDRHTIVPMLKAEKE